MFDRFQVISETVIGYDTFPYDAIYDRTIRLLSWNIAKQNQQQRWQSDFLRIVSTYQPDIICLQEVCLNVQALALLELELMGWQFAPNFVDTHLGCYCGLLTASRAKPVKSKAIVSQYAEPITNTPKVSLITQYQLLSSDWQVWVVNMHAINFVSLKKFQSQLHMLKQHLVRSPAPLILAGDFNTWSQIRLKALNEITNQLSLKPVAFTSSDREQITRFLLSPPLDHIYYRQFWQVPNRATVLGKIASSDHKPLFVELHL